MEDKEFLYHCIDWGLAIILSFVSLINGNYLVIVCVILVALLASILLVAHKNYALKKTVATYEALLKYPIPLYEIVNYLHKQKDAKNSSKNIHIHLDELSLKLTIISNGTTGQKSDVKFEWTFLGRNHSQHEVGNFYLRIAGASPYPFEKLNIECVDCSTDVANCEFRDSIYQCPMKSSCKAQCTPYFVKDDSYGSKSLYLLNINFLEKILPGKDVRLKLSYIWPQSFNAIYDTIFIDPSNFAKGVDKIRLTFTLDNTAIKSNSKIQLFSIHKENNRITNEGAIRLQHEGEGEIFQRLFDVNSNKMYFVTIENP